MQDAPDERLDLSRLKPLSNNESKPKVVGLVELCENNAHISADRPHVIALLLASRTVNGVLKGMMVL